MRYAGIKQIEEKKKKEIKQRLAAFGYQMLNEWSFPIRIYPRRAQARGSVTPHPGKLVLR